MKKKKKDFVVLIICKEIVSDSGRKQRTLQHN